MFLTWRRDRSFSREIAGEYAALLKTAFESWLIDSSDEAAAQSCSRLYQSLPSSGQLRFLRIAATGVKLRRQDDTGEDRAGDFFSQHLRTELGHPRYAIGADEEPPDSGALALADADGREISVDARGIYRFHGPAAVAPYRDEDANLALVRLRESLDLVGAVDRVAVNMIGDVIQLIILRQDATDPSGFSSSSWPGCAGLMALTNIQRPDSDNGWCVDALVHESVHSLLYMIERFEPFYSHATTPVSYRAVSPWSGRELNLHSFVHACFVWFALWCFWSLATTSKFFPRSTIEFFRSRARRGFDTDLLSRLGAGQHEIARSVRDAIVRIENIVDEWQSNQRDHDPACLLP